jgi:hypothetical protein
MDFKGFGHWKGQMKKCRGKRMFPPEVNGAKKQANWNAQTFVSAAADIWTSSPRDESFISMHKHIHISLASIFD